MKGPAEAKLLAGLTVQDSLLSAQFAHILVSKMFNYQQQAFEKFKNWIWGGDFLKITSYNFQRSRQIMTLGGVYQGKIMRQKRLIQEICQGRYSENKMEIF